MAQIKINKYVPLILLITLITLTFTGLYFKRQYDIKQEKILAEQLRIQQENREKARAKINSLFDNYLNNFKDELSEKAKAYKKSRLVLKEMFLPYNFETSEYTKENYFLFKKTVAPNLRKKAAALIETFQKYDDKINKDLKNQDDKIKQFFLKEWQKMSHEKLGQYVDFLTKEDRLIQSYDDLITFYYIHSKLFSVDTKTNKFVFKREQDAKKEAELRQRIKNLSSSRK